jgi:hypothetical protein
MIYGMSNLRVIMLVQRSSCHSLVRKITRWFNTSTPSLAEPDHTLCYRRVWWVGRAYLIQGITGSWLVITGAL